jgi:hypothetical protein
MAEVARRLLLSPGVGERLLTSKLQILSGTGNRRPSTALSIVSGRLPEHQRPLAVAEPPRSVIGDVEPVSVTAHRAPRQFAARTVYLSAAHLADIDRIIEAWQQVQPRRLTRSAVLRRAVEHLRDAVEADPAKSLLEND